MNKEQIVENAKKMECKEDLLALLNQLKRDEMVEKSKEQSFHPFTMRHLNFYCNPNNTFRRYTQFQIPKKSGGVRLITAPRNRSFMLILRYLNQIFKAMYTPSPNAMGFAEGRSVVTNANIHTGMNYVFNIDLKDFFPSIEQPRIWKRLQLKPFSFPVPVANVMAGLCSMKETREAGDGTKKDYYVLPQGAPTSPIITNMVCDNLDRRLAGLAKRFNLNYSRYADDITFSSMHNVYSAGGDFRKELERIIQGQGFQINDKKTRLQKRGSRQEVTGIIVSSKLNVLQRYTREIRNLLYIWDRYGYSVAFKTFFPRYKNDKGHLKKGIPDLMKVLEGKLLYLKMVKGEEDSVYNRLHDKFIGLISSTKYPEKTTEHNITYVETVPLLDFEKRNSTEVIFVMDAKKAPVRVAEDSVEGNSPEKQFHRYAYYVLDGKKLLISIHKDIRIGDEKIKENLAISLCRDFKDSPFSLVHKIEKVTIHPSPKLDIDILNEELDSLLNI